MRLRNRVRTTRLLRNIRASVLARQAGISRQTLVLIERDDGYLPTGATMARLATALNDQHLWWWEPDGTEPQSVEGQV